DPTTCAGVRCGTAAHPAARPGPGDRDPGRRRRPGDRARGGTGHDGGGRGARRDQQARALPALAGPVGAASRDPRAACQGRHPRSRHRQLPRRHARDPSRLGGAVREPPRQRGHRDHRRDATRPGAGLRLPRRRHRLAQGGDGRDADASDRPGRGPTRRAVRDSAGAGAGSAVAPFPGHRRSDLRRPRRAHRRGDPGSLHPRPGREARLV
ncbi:MAG: Transcriptional regulator, AcrR family, partial [uncultured Nocardioidaceae bacterium]